MILGELKKFMMRGNVVDMAVGVVMGGAFGKIVSSLVNDVIMPPVGALVGGVDFKKLSIQLREATETAEGVSLNYGSFLQTIFDFLIISTVIFFAIRAINSLHNNEEEKVEETKPAEASKEELLLAEIRDLLKDK